MAKAPNGPSAKFQIQNLHTMDELKLTGNCLMGSRPLLSFDAQFDTQPHWNLLKHMFIQVSQALSPSQPTLKANTTRHTSRLAYQKERGEVNLSLITSSLSQYLMVKFGVGIIKS